MKILYVAKKYNEVKIKQGLSNAHYYFYDTLTKMNNGSNEVIYFPFDEIVTKKGKEKTNQELIDAVSEKPDLLFSVISSQASGDILKKEVIEKISRESKIITLNWFTDDDWQFDKFSRHWAAYFNWVATTSDKAIKKYHQIGYRNVIKTQWACNHFLYKPLNLPKIYDVTFIGTAHGNRKKIVEKIKRAGINIKCWGGGWPAGRVSQEEMLKIFSQSKINLNFAKCSGILWKELASVFFYRTYNKSLRSYNPKNWFGNFKSMLAATWNREIKGRIFEIPGCGGFLLTEYANRLEDYYEIGKEIDCFYSIPDLIKKIKYYLTNEEKLKAIAKAGYERTLREHTYEKRFNEIFKIIGLVK